MALESDPLIPRTESPQPIGANKPRGLGPMEISKSTRYGILAGIWAGTFLSVCSTTLVATLLPSISSEFNKAHQASWLGTAYLLATCTFTPLYGRLSNVMGRRGANQTAVFFAALGTLACGLSTNMETLIAARFLGGLGGGGIFTTATIVTSDMYSLRNRGLTQGVAAVFNSMGMGLGGPLGGFIADRLGWRWAFLLQMPLFAISFALTAWNLHYVTPGRSKSTKEVLKRIDYGGSATLLVTVLAFLVFLSMRFSEEHPWSSPAVYAPLITSIVFALLFVYVELRIAPEPILAPFLLKEKIPVLVGISNFLVATCNFTVMYNFPTWFQTVLLTSASEAGAHLIPNGISVSCGSLFAGWVMHRTGKYRKLNLIFGIFPFVAAILLALMHENSSPAQLWLSIIPLGFGNAVVLQTMLIALLAHVPPDAMAVGTGFGQLFRGIGQVGGVAISAALFQSILNVELHKRIHTPDAEEMISKIRHSSTLVAQLPPHLQRAARDSYAISLRAVFIFAAIATLAAYLVRLPIPDKILDQPRPRPRSIAELPNPNPTPAQLAEELSASQDTSAVTTESDESDDDEPVSPLLPKRSHRRRLSTYESSDGGMDLEDEVIGGSARR
ncbi:MFS general substrate transporter [Dichomitus squalens LYAD-421 SS1]|uniref:MFS general substrate transporter n=1 Tax=Dichomitus squalens (strain LYAD-421) TaxID=732165 RepID=R7SSR3_DICSQ|nr:MFS general substrate transporter [Dichomitus squalens LYAD-421 SS1]EJF58032.1 MFS general substrate transporter [Dichomitus squalens LYAD-421 SS1]